MEQIIVVDKPRGKTSYDVVREYKQKLGVEKIGHAGSLDPFATGVLILLIGRATKKFAEFLKLEKEYEMVLELGWTTDTLDLTGKKIIKYSNKKINKLKITKAKILKILSSFVGEYEQEAPHFSALKHKGKPLYWYARKGIKVALPKRKVKIKKIELIKFIRFKSLSGLSGYPRLKIKVVCGSGTYMRSLARDIGLKLGLPAVAVSLRRTRVGKYKLGIRD